MGNRVALVHADPDKCDVPITVTDPLAVTSKVADRAVPNSNNTSTVVTAGTRVQLSLTSIPCDLVRVIADKDNVGNIFLGYSTVAADYFDFILEAEDGEYILAADVNEVYIDSDTDGDSVYFTYFT